MNISVVIPVFNAEQYLHRSVCSALEQKEVAEVILVEDGGSAAEFEACRNLERQHERVRLFTHPGRENRGAAASRNLGIRKANHEWVAFLDADDFMLPQRFYKFCEVVEKYPETEAVYEAVGFWFESEERRESFWDRPRIEETTLTTVTSSVTPRRAFRALGPIGDAGYACTDGWTITRALLHEIGGFEESLELHEDTDLFMRVTIAGEARPGSINRAVAMRGVHSENRITRERSREQVWRDSSRMYQSTWFWAKDAGFHREARILERVSLRAFAGASPEMIEAFLMNWSQEYPGGGIFSRVFKGERIPVRTLNRLAWVPTFLQKARHGLGRLVRAAFSKQDSGI